MSELKEGFCDGRPKTIDDLNSSSGAFMYNYNVCDTQRESVDSDGNITNVPSFKFSSVRVKWPKTASNIFKTVLLAEFPIDVQSKMLNEFESAKLEILPEEKANNYKDFLNKRAELKAMVNDDCLKMGIPD